MSFSRRRFTVSAGAFTALQLAPPVTFAASRRTEIDAYFLKLPKWEDYSAPVKAGDISQIPGTADTRTIGKMSCTRTDYNLAANSDKIVIFAPDRQTLWPGALLQGQGYRDGLGSLRELPIKKRAPVTIGIDLLAPKNSKTVTSPDAASVNAAVTELVQLTLAQQDKDFGSSIHFSMVTTHSEEQAMLSLSLSAKYSGAALKATHRTEKKDDENTVTAYFIQNMFTTYVSNPATPARLFSEQLTMEDLREQEKFGRIGPGNPPVLLSSISFGRILYFTITSKSTANEMKQAITASYKAGTDSVAVAAEQMRKKVMSESRITVSTIGGDSKNALALIKSGDIKDYFTAQPSIQTVRPISFTFINLVDLSIAAIRDSTRYTVTECAPAGPTLEMRNRVAAIETTRAEYRRFVGAAVGNWADRRGRAAHVQRYNALHRALEGDLRLLTNTRLPENDKAWLIAYWIPVFKALINTDQADWDRGIQANRSDKGSRLVYKNAKDLAESQKIILDGLRATLEK